MRAEKEVAKAMSNMAAGKDHGLSNDELLEVIRTLGDYRAMACKFADILAASASALLDRRSTGKGERARQASIVLQTLNDLKYETNQRATSSSRQRDAVIERLQGIVGDAGHGDMKPTREPMTYRCAQCGQKHVIGINHEAAVRLGQTKS